MKYSEYSHIWIIVTLVKEVNTAKESYIFILHVKTLGMQFHYGKAMFSNDR